MCYVVDPASHDEIANRKYIYIVVRPGATNIYIYILAPVLYPCFGVAWPLLQSFGQTRYALLGGTKEYAVLKDYL